MQRYSDGLAVPKDMMDVFSGETSDGSGNLALDLTYLPKSINDIIVPDGFDVSQGRRRVYMKTGLAGKVLTVKAIGMQYRKPTTPIDAANSGRVGADPHAHALSFLLAHLEIIGQAGEDQDVITVHYTVA